MKVVFVDRLLWAPRTQSRNRLSLLELLSGSEPGVAVPGGWLRGVRTLEGRMGRVLQRARPLTVVLTDNASVRPSASGVEVIMAAALARLGLRAVKQVRVQFCPFEKNVESTRYEGEGMGTGRDEPGSRRASTPSAWRPCRFPTAGPSSRR